MKDVICLTYFYQPFWGTDQFMKSCKEVGIEVHNAWPEGEKFKGHGDHTKTIQFLYEGIKKIKQDGYKGIIYADAADSYFVSKFIPPEDRLVYSTEKAYYPECVGNLKLRYPTGAVEFPEEAGQWRFLNAGGWCGSPELALEIWEKTGFIDHKGQLSGQHECHKMFWDAVDLGLPIELDIECKLFQSGAFEHSGDFSVITGRDEQGRLSRPYVLNNHTHTVPYLWHFNGRTDATWFYNLYK